MINLMAVWILCFVLLLLENSFADHVYMSGDISAEHARIKYTSEAVEISRAFILESRM